jgi:hypothetical protein
LQEDNNSSTSRAEVDNINLCAKSIITLSASLFDSLKIAINSTTLAPSCNSNK